MKFDEFLRQEKKTIKRKHHNDEEHRIQCACVDWFRMQYPLISHILFAIPNGGKRDAITGQRLKSEGALAGVSDLILLKSNRHYGALCIEMKKPNGIQSKNQKEWQDNIEKEGNKYVICRSIEDFMLEVSKYLKDDF